MSRSKVGEQSAHSSAFCRYHALTAVQSLAAQLQQLGRTDGSGSGSGSGSGISNTAEAARSLFEVMMNTAPTPPADSFPDAVSSWSGAAEVSFLGLGSLHRHQQYVKHMDLCTNEN